MYVKEEKLIDTFNNRELASILLFSLFIAYAFYKTNDRQSLLKSFCNVLISFFQKKLVVVEIFFLFFIFIEIIILNKLFYWDISYLKDTVVWVFSAFFLIVNHSKLVEKEDFLRNILLDNLKFLAIYEFIVNLYTFNFIFEFIVTTTITFLILMQTVLQYQEKDKNTELLGKIINYFLALFTILITFLTIKSLYDDYQHIVFIDYLKKFFLPFLLTSLYLPFYYLMLLIFKYETIFVIVNLYQTDKKLKLYTKILILITCFINYNKLKKVNLRVYFISKSKSKEEIKQMLNDIINDKFDIEKFFK